MMIVDHIGIVVANLEEAIAHWARLFGYLPMTTPIINIRQKVRVVFLSKEGSITIKLIEPTEDSSPVFRAAQKGGGLHHLCFRCAELDVEVARFRSLGLRVLAEPQPGEAFAGERIAFVYAPQGLNIELIDTDKKAGLRGAAKEKSGSS